MDAVLDTGDYPVGVSVSTERMSTLPITPHVERGTWNYTIGPTAAGANAAIGPGDRDRNRSAALQSLADPRLTGMSRGDLAELAADLAPAQAARAEQRYFEQRGGRRRQIKGRHGRSLLTDPDRVLIPVVYLRQVCSQLVLSELLEVSTGPIAAAVTETGRLLAERKHGIEPTVLRFTSAAALRDFLATDIVPARPNRLATLGDPALTGMSRQDLAKLIGRLSLLQAAKAERRKYRHRGADRQFGAGSVK